MVAKKNADVSTNNSNIQQEENKEEKLTPENNRQYKAVLYKAAKGKGY
ncbi:9515_t:CDS:2 [Dentiscutata heterogama]|uniref:9515_t:CDS:1 n=1 Tax=Dentiscutata heterogama TaxID=1316150 RepID=A0ACA9KNG4_9GLOM|nr:9515_t:CDS:2 [Dentiscutata heterogama]